ncbi:MAG: hypothetical protein HY452_00540 [Parcubacteria group bacterium]|nr:hypothetical protein [Parcubacteria group bacterium]
MPEERREKRGRGQQPRSSIELRYQPAKKTVEGGFSIEVEAIVTEGPRALSGRNLQFFVGSAAFSTPEPTDDNGRCKKTITGPIPSSREVRIEVQVVGQATRREITIKIPADPKTSGASDKLSVRYTLRDDGDYMVAVQVADEKGEEKSDVPVTFVADGEVETIPTGNYGIASKKCSPGKAKILVPGFKAEDLDLEKPSRSWNRPEPRTLGERFRANNNFQLMIFWMIVGAHLLFNLAFLGLGPETDSGVSAVQQKYYNLYFHGQYATNNQIHWAQNAWTGIIDFLRSWSWKFWWAELVFSLIYIPVAFWDEVKAGAKAGWRKIQEGRLEQDLPDAAQPTPAATPSISTATRGEGRRSEVWIFVREFFSALVAEIAAKGIRR